MCRKETTHSLTYPIPTASLFKCDFSYSCAAVDKISTKRTALHSPLVISELLVIIRSTPPSRRNKVGLKCPSNRPRVHPQTVSSISMKFVEVDE